LRNLDRPIWDCRLGVEDERQDDAYPESVCEEGVFWGLGKPKPPSEGQDGVLHENPEDAKS